MDPQNIKWNFISSFIGIFVVVEAKITKLIWEKGNPPKAWGKIAISTLLKLFTNSIEEYHTTNAI